MSLSLNKNLLIDERRAFFVITGTRFLSRWNVLVSIESNSVNAEDCFGQN